MPGQTLGAHRGPGPGLGNNLMGLVPIRLYAGRHCKKGYFPNGGLLSTGTPKTPPKVGWTLGCHGWVKRRQPRGSAFWLKGTGMPWLGHRRRGSSLGFCRQPRRSAFWLKGTGMPWLGCPAARAPTVLVIGAVAVPRWLKVCGLVSCVGWSQLWLGVKTTGRCQIHILCVCVSVTSVQARER